MKTLKIMVNAAAVVVFGLCFYASELGSKLLEGRFKLEPFTLYFLAKGIFCSVSMHLSVRILEALSTKRQE